MMRLSALMLTVTLLCGCGDSESEDRDASAPEIVAGVAPIAYLVRRIAGEHLTVGVLVAQGIDPHLYGPTPRQVVRLGQAKLLLTVGLPFENALAGKLRTEMPELTIVDLTVGLDLLDPGELDPHVWMSPPLAALMAREICDALSRADPAHSQAFQRNLEGLLADLDHLHEQLREALAPVRGRTLLVFHPAFGHFAHEYGLIQEAVETGGKAPGPRHIKRLIDLAREKRIRVIFVQPQFSREAAESIAAQINGAVVPLDPLTGDYLTNMTALAETVQQALATPGPDESGG